MSVKRYNYGFGLLVETEGDGMYVLYSDYADLLASHNALVEAARPVVKTWREKSSVHVDEMDALAALVGEE